MQYVYGARLTTFEDSEKESEYGNTTAFYCGSSNLSFGATLLPFSMDGEFPKSAWLVSKMGRLTAGVQYEPQFLSIHMDEQIDGKTLIGSYVCTEKPGEFRWQPGSLTQDIDKAPSDVQSILLPLLEGASSFFSGHGEVLLGIGEIIALGSCPKVLLLNGIHDRETSGFSAACFVTAIANALNRTYGDPHNCLKNHVMKLKEQLSEAEKEIQRLLERCDGVSSDSLASLFFMEAMDPPPFLGEFGMEGFGNIFYVPENNYNHGMDWVNLI